MGVEEKLDDILAEVKTIREDVGRFVKFIFDTSGRAREFQDHQKETMTTINEMLKKFGKV